MGSAALTEQGLSNSMTSDSRIATRYVFESRILIACAEVAIG